MKKIIVISIFIIFSTNQIKPDTDIYVGNYTNQTVKMAYYQIGKNKLKKNNEFKIETNREIKRNQERKMFSVNRNVGIKKDKKYYFEFKFSPRTEMSFVVIIKGLFTGSNMWQKIQSAYSATKYSDKVGLQSLEIKQKDAKRIRFDCIRRLKPGSTYDNLEFMLYEY